MIRNDRNSRSFAEAPEFLQKQWQEAGIGVFRLEAKGPDRGQTNNTHEIYIRKSEKGLRLTVRLTDRLTPVLKTICITSSFHAAPAFCSQKLHPCAVRHSECCFRLASVAGWPPHSFTLAPSPERLHLALVFSAPFSAPAFRTPLRRVELEGTASNKGVMDPPTGRCTTEDLAFGGVEDVGPQCHGQLHGSVWGEALVLPGSARLGNQIRNVTSPLGWRPSLLGWRPSLLLYIGWRLSCSLSLGIVLVVRSGAPG